MKEMYSGWGRNDSAGWERGGGIYEFIEYSGTSEKGTLGTNINSSGLSPL